MEGNRLEAIYFHSGKRLYSDGARRRYATVKNLPKEREILHLGEEHRCLSVLLQSCLTGPFSSIATLAEQLGVAQVRSGPRWQHSTCSRVLKVGRG